MQHSPPDSSQRPGKKAVTHQLNEILPSVHLETGNRAYKGRSKSAASTADAPTVSLNLTSFTNGISMTNAESLSMADWSEISLREIYRMKSIPNCNERSLACNNDVSASQTPLRQRFNIFPRDTSNESLLENGKPTVEQKANVQWTAEDCAMDRWECSRCRFKNWPWTNECEGENCRYREPEPKWTTATHFLRKLSLRKYKPNATLGPVK